MSNSKFYHRSHYPERADTPRGSIFEPQYREVLDDRGVVNLVQDGEINTDEMIQSAAVGTDINSIIKRYEAGDLAVLGNPDLGSFVDLTRVPKSLAEAQQMILDSRAAFERLPLDLRDKYHNNLFEFLQAYDRGDFFEQMKDDDSAAVFDKEVKADE